jgi:hypothetical protein
MSTRPNAGVDDLELKAILNVDDRVISQMILFAYKWMTLQLAFLLRRTKHLLPLELSKIDPQGPKIEDSSCVDL